MYHISINRTYHVSWFGEPELDGRDLGSTYVLHSPNDRVVPTFGVTEFMEFTKIFQSTPVETEKTE